MIVETTAAGCVWARAVLLSLLALSGREARAAPLTVRLEYAAGPGCPDAADFKAVVIARLGYDPFIESAPEHVLVRIEPRAARHRRTHRVARCERQVGRRADVPVGEHRLSSPGARDGLCARRADPAPGEGDRSRSRRERARLQPEAAPGSAARSSRPSREPPIAGSRRRRSRPSASAADAGPAASRRASGRCSQSGQDRPSGSGCRRRRSCSGVCSARSRGSTVSVELAAVVSLPATTRRAGRRRLHAAASAGQRRRVRDRHAMDRDACWRTPATVRMAGENIDRPTSATVPLVASRRASRNHASPSGVAPS